MPVQFLPPTKLQLKVLDHFVEEQGFGSGVHKLYRRLKTLFDGVIHPAMDDEGNVAYALYVVVRVICRTTDFVPERVAECGVGLSQARSKKSRLFGAGFI